MQVVVKKKMKVEWTTRDQVDKKKEFFQPVSGDTNAIGLKVEADCWQDADAAFEAVLGRECGSIEVMDKFRMEHPKPDCLPF